MSAMTEKIEVSDRNAYRILPQTEIPVLENRDISKYKGEDRKEYKYTTGTYMT